MDKNKQHLGQNKIILVLYQLSKSSMQYYYKILVFCKVTAVKKKTNMMWPSQNFLLYNGTVIKIQVNEWINN